MVFPISSNGTSDMFPPSYFNEAAWAGYCQSAYQVTPRPDWIPIYYGATNIQAASNIIFSNGMLDPWRGGGVQESLSGLLPVI
jgi:lysosomal Pro-X carboxypeptidase